MGLPSCVLGMRDITHDCQTPKRAECSPNVLLHGIGWSLQGDINTTHIYGPKCKSSHAMPIAVGSTTVKVNGVGAGRETDAVASCTAVAEGHEDIQTGG